MAIIEIKVVNPTKTASVTMQVPNDVVVRDLTDAIVKGLELPLQGQGGRKLRYRLGRKNRDRELEQLEDNRTLNENGVRDDDSLELVKIDFDLLVGRDDELEHFREVLKAEEASSQESSSRVLFIYGEGGIGKTALVQAFKNVIKDQPPLAERWQILDIDWAWQRESEFEPDLRVAPEQVDPKTVFNIIVKEVKNQLIVGDTSNYNKAVENLEKASWLVAQALQRESHGGDFEPLHELDPYELQMLLRTKGEWRPPYLTASQKPVELVRQANNFLYKCFDDPELHKTFRQPYERLSSGLSQDLKTFSDEPIMICLDAYDLIQSKMVDQCLLDVIRSAGDRIVWVIAGRKNPFEYPNSPFSRYQEVFGRAITIEEIRLQALSEQDVKHYFNECVPDRHISDDEAAEVHSTTWGIPLVVSLAAEWWASGAELKAITESDPSIERKRFVRRIATRLLRYSVEPHDRDVIYMLAMMRRQDNELLFSALVQRAENNEYQRLPQMLSDLEKRDSFIWSSDKRTDSVLRFLREYLLNRRWDSAKDELSLIAGKVLGDRLKYMTTNEAMPLHERWSDRIWVETSLDLVHLKFWRVEDEDKSWQEFTLHFLEAIAYGHKWIKVLLNVVGFFRPNFSPEGERRFRIFYESQHEQAAVSAQEALIQELTKLSERGWFSDSLHQAEHMAILKWQEGVWHLRRRDYEQALRCYQQAQPDLSLVEGSKLCKRFAESHLAIAQAIVGPTDRDAIASSLEDAMVASQEAINLDSQLADAHYIQATVLSKFGRYKDAITPALRATEIDDTVFEFWRLRGLIYLNLGQLTESGEAFEQAIALNDQELEPYLKLGEIYYDLRNYEKAHEAYRHAVALKPEEVIAQSGLGDTCFALGTGQVKITKEIRILYAKAESAYKRVIQLVPENARAHANLANVHLRLRRRIDAIKTYKHACERDHEWSYPYHQLGKVYALRGEFEAATEPLETAVKLEPQNADTLYWLGNVYYERGDYDQAYDVYERAVAADRKNVLAHYGRGRALLALTKFKEASLALETAIELDPNRLVFYYYLCRAYYALQEYNTALATCERIGKHKYVPLYCILGDHYAALHQYEEAAKAYENALGFASKTWSHLQWSLVHSSLGEIYYIRQKFPNSIGAFTEALKLTPTDAWLYYNRGLVYYVRDRHQKALESFQQAIEHDPDLSWPYGGLGMVYLSLGDLSKAADSYQQALKQAQDQDATMHLSLSLGVIYLHQDKQKLAEDHFRRVVEIYVRFKTSPGPSDRCCYTLAQLGMDRTPTVPSQDWSNDLIDVQAAGEHHYRHEWLAVSKLLPETSVSTDYLEHL